MKKNVLVFLLSGIICCSVAHAQKDTGFSHMKDLMWSLISQEVLLARILV